MWTKVTLDPSPTPLVPQRVHEPCLQDETFLEASRHLQVPRRGNWQLGLGNVWHMAMLPHGLSWAVVIWLGVENLIMPIRTMNLTFKSYYLAVNR